MTLVLIGNCTLRGGAQNTDTERLSSVSAMCATAAPRASKTRGEKTDPFGYDNYERVTSGFFWDS